MIDFENLFDSPDGISFNEVTGIITGTDDPTSVDITGGTGGPIPESTMYIRTGVSPPEIYIKGSAGATDWTLPPIDITQTGSLGLGQWTLEALTSSPPANASFRFNNADPLLATELYVDYDNNAGANLTPVFDAVTPNTLIYAQQGADASQGFVATVTTVTPGAGFVTYGLTGVSDLGITIASGELYSILFASFAAISGIDVQQDDSSIVSTATTLNFEGGATVVDEGSGKATVTVTDDDKVEWKNTWIPTQYDQNDMVRDGDWTMIANKQTTDRAAPTPDGDPEFLLSETPTWSAQNNLSTVEVQHTYTFAQSGWLPAIRIWPQTVSSTYEYRLRIRDITNPSEPIIRDIPLPVSQLMAGTWNTIQTNNAIVIQGTILELELYIIDSSSDTTFTGGWTFDAQSGGNSTPAVPLAESFTTNGQFSRVRVDKDDLNSTDRSSELASVTPDSTIELIETGDVNNNVTLRVEAGPIDGGSYVEYITTLIDVGPGGNPTVGETTTINFDVPVPALTDYIEEANIWNQPLPDFMTSVTSALFYDGVDQSASANTAYGIDVQFQRAYISPDWDLVATSQIINASGGGGVSSDELVKVSANDTVAGFLNGKLVTGTNITLTENNDGANETLTIATTAEINTGSNLGAGVGPFDGKVGADLQFRSLVSNNAGLTIVLDGNEIDFTIVPGGIDHGSLSGLGDDDHPQYVLTTGDTMTGDLIMDEAELIIRSAGGLDVIFGFSGGGTPQISRSDIGGAMIWFPDAVFPQWLFGSDAAGTNAMFIDCDNNGTLFLNALHTGPISLGPGGLQFSDGSSNLISVVAPSISSDYTLTLPVDDGLVDQVLRTDGAGVLSWVDQTSDTGITELTGDVTAGPGSGSQAATITDDAVTYAKMQNVVANNVLLGNNSGAGSIVEELTAAEVRVILNVEDGAAADQNLWETINADTGSTVADSVTDALTIAGGTDIETVIVGDTLTINWNGSENDLPAFDAYIDTTGVTITTTGVWTDVPLDVQRTIDGTVYTHTPGAAEVEVDEDGLYEIEGRSTLDQTGGNSRTEAAHRLVLDTGGGFNFIPGTVARTYHRNNAQASDTGVCRAIISLSAGDQVKLQSQRVSGGGSLTMLLDGCNLTLTKLEGIVGPQGPQGDPGIGATIIVEDDGAAVPNGPFTTLDFVGNRVTASDGGSGTATITIDDPIKTYEFFADQVRFPFGGDWNVTPGAPASADSNNSALIVRLFDDSTDEAIGFSLTVPATATEMTVRTKARAETAPGATQNAIMVLHKRSIGDNAAVSGWTTNALTTIALPTNENFQYDETVDTLSNWGLTTGVTYQMQLSRDANAGGDTLVGDLALHVIEIEFR